MSRVFLSLTAILILWRAISAVLHHLVDYIAGHITMAFVHECAWKERLLRG